MGALILGHPVQNLVLQKWFWKSDWISRVSLSPSEFAFDADEVGGDVGPVVEVEVPGIAVVDPVVAELADEGRAGRDWVMTLPWKWKKRGLIWNWIHRREREERGERRGGRREKGRERREGERGRREERERERRELEERPSHHKLSSSVYLWSQSL